jgi:hypothetical protein
MKVPIIVSVVILIYGCAQKPMYTKPNITQSEWSQDLATCQYEAAASTQSTDYNLQTAFGQELDRELRKNDLIGLCLRAKGYVLVTQESQ